jgi:hypothetical protein
MKGAPPGVVAVEPFLPNLPLTNCEASHGTKRTSGGTLRR